jgi:glyceraldehyde-3-phosphate dehydrogenase/erythrose-4-phosphate dehydrogenase
MTPTSTGAAIAATEVIPSLKGKFISGSKFNYI